MSKSHHYHLFATDVAFLEPENEQIGSLKINVLLRTTDKNITARDLGKAQQVAQMTFFEKMQNPNLQVKDVLLLSLAYLGFMTEEKFQSKKDEAPVAKPAPKGAFDA